jgi:inward rectifier potassium channel
VSTPYQDPNADLGFGSVVTRESRKRFLNRNGSFNVRREGYRPWESLSAYHYLITMSWPKFLWLTVAAYLVVNSIFAFLYVSCGPGTLKDTTGTMTNDFAAAFFFSVQTLATIGYGGIVPATVAANVIVTIEALAGLLGFALVAGIVFARFARPTAQILFSRNALVAPYRGGTALMFRIINQRRNEMVELDAKVMLARRKKGGAITDREFIPLELERDHVVFFPLSWTIVHPIDDASPLRHETETTLKACDVEILILLNGFDETFSQTVHTRSSYKQDEIVWGARFVNMFNPPRNDGDLSVDVRRLSEYEKV